VIVDIILTLISTQPFSSPTFSSFPCGYGMACKI